MTTTDTHGQSGRPWIGVDLDGTLAHYDGWKGPEHIGDPIPIMLSRVQSWISKGKEVRIVTARVAPGKGDAELCRKAIDEWVGKHVGVPLPVTHEKDHLMDELWDDRCVQVIKNTGERADERNPKLDRARLEVALSVLSDVQGLDVQRLREDASAILRLFLAPPMIVVPGPRIDPTDVCKEQALPAPTVPQNANRVTREHIDALIAASAWSDAKMGDKTTVVCLRLPNGFEIIEASGCVDPANYDHKLGVEICRKRIVDQVWKLEGFALADRMHRAQF